MILSHPQLCVEHIDKTFPEVGVYQDKLECPNSSVSSSGSLFGNILLLSSALLLKSVLSVLVQREAQRAAVHPIVICCMMSW